MKKFLFISCCTLLVSGCAATPIDFLIPTKKPSVVTQEYLGSLYTTNRVSNMMYHSLSDTKYEKAMIPVRKVVLEGLYYGAKAEIDTIDKIGTATSNGVWGLIVAGAGLMGWQIPRPQEKAKVTEALYKDPPKSI